MEVEDKDITYPDITDMLKLNGKDFEQAVRSHPLFDGTIRQNLMLIPNYTPYCGFGEKCDMPRTRPTKDFQFECPCCDFVTKYPEDFITAYRIRWGKN